MSRIDATVTQLMQTLAKNTPGDQQPPVTAAVQLMAQQSNSRWAIVSIVMGFAIQVGSLLADSMSSSANAKYAVIGMVTGAIVQCLAILQKTLVNMKYIQSQETENPAATVKA